GEAHGHRGHAEDEWRGDGGVREPGRGRAGASAGPGDPTGRGRGRHLAPLSFGGRDFLRGDPRRRPAALRGGHGLQDHGRVPGRQRGHGQEGTRRDPHRLTGYHSPETAPAVAASSASIAAPGSLPSVAAFLYGLAGPRRSLPPE